MHGAPDAMMARGLSSFAGRGRVAHAVTRGFHFGRLWITAEVITLPEVACARFDPTSYVIAATLSRSASTVLATGSGRFPFERLSVDASRRTLPAV